MKVVATYLQKRKMEDLGRANSYQTQNVNPDSRVWNDGWSPERVATEIGGGINAHHVRGFYRIIGLEFRNGPGVPQEAIVSGLRSRIDTLQARVDALEAIVAEIQSRRVPPMPRPASIQLPPKPRSAK